MKSKAVLFVVGLLVWTGLTWADDWQDLLVGVLVALFVSFMTGDMFIQAGQPCRRGARRYFWFLLYVPFFAWECFKANVDVAYRVGHPDVPINPGIVKVKTKLKSDTGITFLANSITLTPGTLSVDADKENGLLYVHWINVKDKEIEAWTKSIVERFEPMLLRIFE